MRRCVSVPPSPIPKKHEFCTVKGCGKETHGKQYCVAHMNVAVRRQLPQELRAIIRSACCSAKCVSGKAHDNGEQYCVGCKEPCCWRAVIQ